MEASEVVESILHISEKPWSEYTKADYSIEQWHAACLVHLHDGPPTSKDQCKLPVKTPNGALNRNGVHAAAAALAGARTPLQAPPDKKAKAASALRRYYNQLGEEPPDSLKQFTFEVGEEFLAHFGTKGMKWGVRKAEVHPEIAHIPHKTRKEASKDAEEFTRAKLYYGKGAGTRRKLIKAKVESKKEKDPLYKKAFDHFVKRTDLGQRAVQARRQRKRANVGESLKRTGKGTIHVLRGRNQYANTAAVVGVGVGSYLLKDHILQQNEDLENDVQDFLEHHGVKGMKWGVRRKATVGPQEVVISDKRKLPGFEPKLRARGGEGHPTSADARRARTIGRIGKKSGLKSLSDQELRDYSNRLQLEANVRRLNYNESNAGKRFVLRMLGRQGEREASTATKLGARQVRKHAARQGARALAKAGLMAAAA